MELSLASRHVHKTKDKSQLLHIFLEINYLLKCYLSPLLLNGSKAPLQYMLQYILYVSFRCNVYSKLFRTLVRLFDYIVFYLLYII